MEVLQALTSNTQIVKEAIQKGRHSTPGRGTSGLRGGTSVTVCLPLSGSLIYLLNLFCNSTVPSVREETAALFGKMITDKLVGPRVRIILSKFLPNIFMDAMKDSPETSLHMFDSEWAEGGVGGWDCPWLP